MRVNSSTRAIVPFSIARITGLGTRPAARTLRQQQRVVPAVAHGLLRRARGALHHQREAPQIAAARCSLTQLLAVPGTPSSSSARSVASVATATSISRRSPMYLADTAVPSGSVPPSKYVQTAQGDSRQLGGRGRVSARANASSSCANSSSAARRKGAPAVALVIVSGGVIGRTPGAWTGGS